MLDARQENLALILDFLICYPITSGINRRYYGMQTPTTFSELTRYRHALAIGVIIYAAFFPPTIKAVAISLDLGPAGNITSEVVTSFSALNGLSLAGQNISLDFTFTNAEFVRLFTLTSESFSTLLTLQTSGTGLVGFLDGTGFLSDQNGNPLHSPQILGSASGSDGTMAAGLFPFFSNELQHPLDFYDVHFDLTLPVNSSISITGAQFSLNSEPGRPFGVGPGVPVDIVPDMGSTFMLLSLGSLIPVVARVRLARAG